MFLFKQAHGSLAMLGLLTVLEPLLCGFSAVELMVHVSHGTEVTFGTKRVPYGWTHTLRQIEAIHELYIFEHLIMLNDTVSSQKMCLI